MKRYRLYWFLNLILIVSGCVTQPVYDPEVDRVNYQTLTAATFDETVLSIGTIAMVVFLEGDDDSCRYLDSVVQCIAPEFLNRVMIARVNVPDAHSLSERYAIATFPHILFFKNGQEETSSRISGPVLADTLLQMLEKILAGENVRLIDGAGFNVAINSMRIVMVDIFTPSCHYCSTMQPIVSALADTFYREALIAKCDVSFEDSLKAALNIKGWPTFIFFKDGIEYYRILGTSSFAAMSTHLRDGLEAN